MVMRVTFCLHCPHIIQLLFLILPSKYIQLVLEEDSGMGKTGEGGCTCLHGNCTPGERLGSEVHKVDVRERLLTAATESSKHDQVLCTGKEQAAVARYPHIEKHNKIFTY